MNEGNEMKLRIYRSRDTFQQTLIISKLLPEKTPCKEAKRKRIFQTERIVDIRFERIGTVLAWCFQGQARY